jgi:hypothetical protein
MLRETTAGQLMKDLQKEMKEAWTRLQGQME